MNYVQVQQYTTSQSLFVGMHGWEKLKQAIIQENDRKNSLHVNEYMAYLSLQLNKLTIYLQLLITKMFTQRNRGHAPWY